MSQGGRRAVFLDRDGTINEEVHYLARPRDVRLLPGAAEAIARLNAAGLAVVVVSNQSGLARGYFGEADLDAVQAELVRQLAARGARLDAFYHCPHHPRGSVSHLAVRCGCRKPEPGLLLAAAADLGLDLDGSFMVGDRQRDVASGRRAGAAGILVRSGHDDGERPLPGEEPHLVAADLAEAADWILARLADVGGAA